MIFSLSLLRVRCDSRLAETGYYIWDYRRQVRNRGLSLTQRELNKAYEGPAFELKDRYGEQLGVLFVIVMFGSAMPLMYLICAVSFTVSYKLEKYYLLQVEGAARGVSSG